MPKMPSYPPDKGVVLTGEGAGDYAIISMDLAGNIVGWTASATYLLGWNSSEAINQHLSFAYLPEDQHTGIPHTDLALAHDQDHYVDERWYRHKNGNKVYAKSETRALYGQNQEPVGFVKVLHKITQPTFRGEPLEILGHVSDSVIVWDFHSGNLLYLNRAAQRKYACPSKEAAQANIQSFFETDQHEKFQSIKASLHENGFWEGVLTYTTKTGEQGASYHRLILERSAGQNEIVLQISQEAFYKEEVKTAFHTSEKRFRTLVTAINQVVWVTDAQGYAIEDSTSWRSFTGQTYKEYKELGWLEAVHPDDRALVVDNWFKAVDNKSIFKAEYRIRKWDGEFYWTAAQAAPVLNDDGSIKEWIGANTDISSHKKLELDRKRFVSLAEQTPDFITISDMNMHLIWCNEVAADMIGKGSKKNLSKQNVLDLFFEEDKAHVHDEFLPKVIKEGSAKAEVRLRNSKTGEAIWVICNAFILQDERGLPVGCAAISHDITERKKIEEDLRRTQLRLESTLDAAEVATWIWNIQEDCVIPDRNLAKLFSIPYEKTNSSPVSTYFEVIHEDDVEPLRALIEHVFKTGEPFHPTFRVRGPEGKYHWLIGRGRLKYDDIGRPLTLSGVFLDITRQREVEEALRVSNQRLNLAIEGAGEGFWEWDIKNNKVRYSHHIAEISGFTLEELGEEPAAWFSRVHPEDVEKTNLAMREHLEGKTSTYSCEYRVQCKTGNWKWIHCRGVVIESAKEEPLRVAGIIGDISPRKEAEEHIWRLANFDVLTGLPNRRLFQERLRQEISTASKYSTSLALLFIDLDRFKHVNDLLGHTAGDLILIEAADRLKKSVASVEAVARLGGDEFTITLGNLAETEHAEVIAEKLISRLSEPFQLGTEKVFLTASVGISIYPHDALLAEELIRKADQAMYVAKHAGKNQFSYFTKRMDEEAHWRLRLLQELHNAVQLNQITVYYQPVVDIKSGQVVKAEALIRWNHPTLGNISPAHFIPLAEESGLISTLGNHVFKKAVHQLKEWHSKFGISFQVSINKSPLQFKSKDDNNWVDYLAALGIPSSSVVVEITEGLLLDNSAGVSSTLLEYRDAGVQVAIDDFGTGYSSMAYLQKFDIDYIKIDQSFIRDIETNIGNKTIAESMIAMAHKLGLKVIAEGVESDTQMEILASAECDFGQGYLFSKPISAYEFENLMTMKRDSVEDNLSH